MDEVRRKGLQEAGVDVDSVLERVMGNEALLERLFRKLTADTNYQRLEQAIGAEDREGALAAAHTLKGACGNLSVTILFELLTKQVEAFRAGDWNAAVSMQQEVSAEYFRVMEKLKEVFSE